MWDFSTILLIGDRKQAANDSEFAALDATGVSRHEDIPVALRESPYYAVRQLALLDSPRSVITFRNLDFSRILSDYASSYAGICNGDTNRFVRFVWETDSLSNSEWSTFQSTPDGHNLWSGMSKAIRWVGDKDSEFTQYVTDRLGEGNTGAWIRGNKAWSRKGVVVGLMGRIPTSPYLGSLFDDNVAVVVPRAAENVAAVLSYMQSAEFVENLRAMNKKISVKTQYLLRVPFDVERWRKAAVKEYSEGLPEPWSDDPTQWLFQGPPEVSTEPLQVAVGRLVGYRWPEQPESDALDEFADADGIVCLPAVAGELPAADRLQALLTAAYGNAWSPGRVQQLLEQTGSSKRNLVDWLRDDFFRQHCMVFSNRPFVWHLWDGRKDGFAALVNYHRLDRAGLEKLTYTYLGDWIERQRADAAEDVAGADVRLAAARALRAKLEAILEGEPPYDIYVRWKALHEQPIGWDPDLDDGVRLNIRPFVESGVLRSKVNVHWKQDRGKNPDGSERHNYRHYTRAEKQQARQEVGDG